MIMVRALPRRPQWWWIAGGAAALVVVGFVLWPISSDRELPPPRAVVYKDFQACLLTGPQGLADPTIALIWEGMQDASKATRAKVSHLATAGSDTVADTTPYVATLLQRQCNVVVTVGETHSAVAIELASGHPDVRFVAIGGSTGSANVTRLPEQSAEQQRTAVGQLIRDLVPK